jgi:type VI secretion system protein ImpL
MFAFLKRRGFLLVVGFLLVAAFIWLAGPYFAFADYRPLETELARLIAIGVVAVLWFASVVLKKIRAFRASDKLVAAVVKQSKAEERPSADALQLRERFEEAAATLKQKRRGGHSLYELPWYVIIGAPGSGKTTALVNSGLHFPLEQRSGRGALRGVGGTRNCDWWFTDEAVLLDTAGRFTTQDSDAGADSAGWLEFLSLLKKYRTRRPINGVILTVSAQDLMTQHAESRETYVAAARRRLNELNRELHIQLPVYVMVTKCDLVAGFTEYFDDLTQEGRAQVWGMTFPYEQTVKGEAPRVYPLEFDELIGRLNARLFARLEEDRDAGRGTRMFGFPQQMAALRELLGQFVTDVFASTRFDQQQVLLRGIYFTSGTQEGTPIDRLLGAIGRRFAVAPDAVVSSGGRGKAYFIERFLKDVLLAESGLAGVNRRFEVRKAAAQLGAYAAMALFAIVAVLVLSFSYVRNRDYVAQVAADVNRLAQVPPIGAAAALESILPRLDAVRAVSDSANRYADRAPWAMRWGLFQGSSLGNAARDAYMRELDGALLPQVAARIRERLVDYVPEPEKLYEYLKAYLMLGEPEHLNKEQLKFIADLEWKSLDSADTEAGAALSQHFGNLLQYEDRLRPIELDQSLVAQARSTIRQASIGGLIYRQVRLGYASDTSRALRLDVAAGIGADRVLRRKSGLPLSQPVISLYTKPVFNEITSRGTNDLVKQIASDQWVWGEGGAPRVGSTAIAAEFTDLYERDYIAFWDGIVKDIQPVSMGSLGNTKEALAILSGPTSPLRGLLKTIDEQTYLVKPPDPAAKPGIVSTIDNVFNRGKQAVGLSTVPPGTKVTAHFADIHRLVSADQGAAPIDSVIDKLKQVQKQLEPVGPTVGGTNPADPTAINNVGELVNELKREATALPPSIAAIVNEVADRTAVTIRRSVGGTIDTRYRTDVVNACREVVQDRYPFVPTSTTDVPLADFGRVFGYGGVFDRFFKNEIEPLVDTSRAPWTWRTDQSGVSVGTSTFMLRQFESAQRIRDMFFRPGGQEAEVRFRVTPTELDADATRFLLEVDGQNFEYRHGPERSAPASWPGQSAGPAAVTFEMRAGGRPNAAFQGAWAWFRLLDNARLSRETEVRYDVTFAKDGHEAQVRLDAASIRNPFNDKDTLRQFRCSE